jgi:hypothetical protein
MWWAGEMARGEAAGGCAARRGQEAVAGVISLIQMALYDGPLAGCGGAGMTLAAETLTATRRRRGLWGGRYTISTMYHRTPRLRRRETAAG